MFWLRNKKTNFLSCTLIWGLAGAQKNRLIETVLLSTHNIMFWLRNKKNNFLLRTLIWGLAGMPVFIFQCGSVTTIKENMFMYAGNSMEN